MIERVSAMHGGGGGRAAMQNAATRFDLGPRQGQLPFVCVPIAFIVTGQIDIRTMQARSESCGCRSFCRSHSRPRQPSSAPTPVPGAVCVAMNRGRYYVRITAAGDSARCALESAFRSAYIGSMNRFVRYGRGRSLKGSRYP